MRLAIGASAMLAMACSRMVEPPAFSEAIELGTHHVTRATDVPPAPPADRAKIRFHMGRHFDDLGAIEHELRSGDLAQATALAYLLARPLNGLRVKWPTETAAVGAAALALARARTIEEGCRLEPRVAVACASCHRAAGVELALAPRAAPPFDARMARDRSTP